MHSFSLTDDEHNFWECNYDIIANIPTTLVVALFLVFYSDQYQFIGSLLSLEAVMALAKLRLVYQG
jgi:hypothetical protein